ncbi:MAG: ABC transporter permease [Eubacteriales bacterium]|nr:ABC transporter permease [Eubacteriales bacterium]MDD4422067.1 ABC transporter permease [Eubacteriales bacterium]
MKILFLIFKNIKYYIKFNKAVFLLFTTGILSSTLALIFFYGNINPIKTEYINDDLYSRQYQFSFFPAINEININDMFDKYFEPEYSLFISKIDNRKIKNTLSEKELTGREFTVGYIYDNLDRVGIKLKGRNKFLESEITNSENTIIVSKYTEYYLDVNINPGLDKITINDIEYTIVGVAQMDSDFLLPSTTYIKNGFETNEMIVVAKEKPSYYDNIEILRLVRDKYPNLETISTHPYRYYDKIQKETPIILFLLAIVFTAMSIAFMFLLKYLADNTNYVSVIHTICGASKETVIFIKLMAVFLTTLAISITGALLHMMLYDVLFQKLNIVDNLTYNFKDYLLIVSVACIASVIISIPFIVSFSKNSTITNKIKFC